MSITKAELIAQAQSFNDIANEAIRYITEGRGQMAPGFIEEIDTQIKHAMGLAIQTQFKVQVITMRESHRLTYWVTIDNLATRPADATIFNDEGRMQPYYSEIEEQAVHTAAEWARFLGVPDQVECHCPLCYVYHKTKDENYEREEKPV
jgi:hypothetical protein